MQLIRILMYFNRLKAMSDEEFELRKKAWSGLGKIYQNEINSLCVIFSTPIEIITKSFPVPSDEVNSELIKYLFRRIKSVRLMPRID